MKSFRQFLIEKFHKGATVYGGAYVEIYKNPSLSEVRTCNGTGQVGAWLVGNDLYIWDRGDAEHGDVRSQIPSNGVERIPLYLYYDNDFPGEVEISVASFSVEGKYRSMSNNQIAELCKKRRPFKIFKQIDAFKR